MGVTLILNHSVFLLVCVTFFVWHAMYCITFFKKYSTFLKIRTCVEILASNVSYVKDA